MGRVQGIMVDIDGASTRAEFEVIEIMDESTTYPAFLGIDWVNDMNGVISSKKRTMIFETKSLCVVVPLDPAKGPRYIEPVHNEESSDESDGIYRMVAQRQEWVKAMEDQRISQGNVESCTTDKDEEDEQWHNRLNGVTMLHCNMVTKSLYCVRAQDHKLPTYDGLTIIDEFLTKFEIAVREHQWFDVLTWALLATPT